MSTSRRRFLTGVLGAGAAGLAAGAAAGAALEAPSAAADPPVVPVDFHGTRQSGVTTVQQRHSTLVSFDVLAADKAGLTDLFKQLTDRSRFLMTGGTPPDPGIGDAPLDNGILGPEVPTDRLSVTVGVGASLFDDRYGLASRKPAGLKTMTTFPNDHLDPAKTGGDLSVQLCADSPDTVLHALRDIAKHTRGAMQIRWQVAGFTSPPRPSGTPRNLMGFKDGTSNLEPTDNAVMDRYVWLGSDAGWAAGGTYLVARQIRMLTEFWDRVSLHEQENMFGRRRDTGAPLDGQNEKDVPNFAADPVGAAIPLTSHIRRANPRSAQSEQSRIYRRPYNYHGGVDQVGNLDQGLLFICYQKDVTKQFEAVQTRLVDEPLVDYIQPVGGGYFLVLPGVPAANGHFGQSLLS